MPTYEYRCRDCGEPLEVVQSFTDGPLTMCPACGGELRKVFQAVGIAFKGSGFYKTDSRKPAKASSSSDSASESSGSSDVKSTSSGSSDVKSTSSGANGDGGSSGDGAKSSSKSSSSSAPAKDT
jgi:putative FmdB family regulatory protein